MNPQGALSVPQFCQLVGLSRNTFREMPDHQLPRVVRRGTRTLIPIAEVQAWLAWDRAVDSVDCSAFTLTLRKNAEEVS